LRPGRRGYGQRGATAGVGLRRQGRRRPQPLSLGGLSQLGGFDLTGSEGSGRVRPPTTLVQRPREILHFRRGKTAPPSRMLSRVGVSVNYLRDVGRRSRGSRSSRRTHDRDSLKLLGSGRLDNRSSLEEDRASYGAERLSGGPTVPPEQGSGSDYLFGRAGNDTLLLTGPNSGGAVEGGAGDDTIRTDNSAYVNQPVGNLDRISCGKGHDVVRADSADLPWWGKETWAAAGCEVVYVSGKQIPTD
jgi:RTX calcium-binding nonapeptide repeat (4 copies)